MYAIVRKVKSKNPDELLRKARQPLEQLNTQQPGFVSFCVVKLPDGWFNSFTIFETRQQAETADRKAQDWFRQNAQNLIEGTPESAICEVVIYKAAEIPEIA